MFKFLKRIMNKIIINGNEYSVKGKNIVAKNISNSSVRITVDGVTVVDINGTNPIVIKFEGDLASLSATHADVAGNINGNVDTTHLKARNITGNVKSTHVNLDGNIKGDVNSTHVTANSISGNVKAIHVN